MNPLDVSNEILNSLRKAVSLARVHYEDQRNTLCSRYREESRPGMFERTEQEDRDLEILDQQIKVLDGKLDAYRGFNQMLDSEAARIVREHMVMS